MFTAPIQPLRLAWSADGSVFAHAAAVSARDKDNAIVMANGKRVTPAGYRLRGSPVFAQQGRQLGHLAQASSGAYTLIVDGKKVASLKGVPAAPMVATSSGFAWVELRGKEWYRVEWRPSKSAAPGL